MIGASFIAFGLCLIDSNGVPRFIELFINELSISSIKSSDDISSFDNHWSEISLL